MTAMSGTPAYIQVAEDIRSQIRSGTLEPGDQLPSMTDLRQQYGVSNTVVRDALNELRRDGLVVGQRGKGVFVRAADDLAASRDTENDPSTLRRELADLRHRVEAIELRLGAGEEASR